MDKLVVQKASLLFFLILMFVGLLQANDLENIGPSRENGILSSDESDHIEIQSALVVSLDWQFFRSKRHVACKHLNESISVDELMALFGFIESDLVPLSEKERSEFDETSVYFKSCNYKGTYHSPIYNWGADKNQLLNWTKTDAYIDAEYSILLVSFLDEKKREVRALFINKEYQLNSNKYLSIWSDLKILYDSIGIKEVEIAE